MTAAGKDDQRSGVEPRPRLHRPTDDLKELPRLKPKPVGSRPEAEVSTPPVRAGTLFAVEHGKGVADSADAAREPSKKVVLRKIEEGAGRSVYATHRLAPPDERAEKEEVGAIGGRRSERTVSTGFLLGVALIVVVLLGGVFIVRLSKKVGALEKRVSHLETANAESLAAGSSLP